MVETFKKILERILLEKGGVNMFALLKMDELTDKWTVILSAPWIDRQNIGEAFKYLHRVLMHDLSNDQLSEISRIGVFPKDEHLVESLLVFKPGMVITEDTKINGNIVHQGFILASDSQL